MRFLRRLILPTVLIALLLLSLFTAMDYFAALERTERDPAAPSSVTEQDTGTQLGQPSTDGPSSGERARGVDSESFAPPFAAEPGRLTRVEPRPPLTPEEEEEETPAETLLHRPVTDEAGSISFAGGDLRLSGIAPTPAGRVCESDSGVTWPCGMIARTAFRNYLRGRALTCDVPAEEWQDMIEATCRLGDTDIAGWLAGNGWAAAEPGSPYEELSETAETEERGIFGPDPRR